MCADRPTGISDKDQRRIAQAVRKSRKERIQAKQHQDAEKAKIEGMDKLIRKLRGWHKTTEH